MAIKNRFLSSLAISIVVFAAAGFFVPQKAAAVSFSSLLSASVSPSTVDTSVTITVVGSTSYDTSICVGNTFGETDYVTFFSVLPDPRVATIKTGPLAGQTIGVSEMYPGVLGHCDPDNGPNNVQGQPVGFTGSRVFDTTTWANGAYTFEVGFTDNNMSYAKSEVSFTVAHPAVNYSLTVTKAGTGSGTVTSNPAGINCGSDCIKSFSSGTTVILTATPAAGSVFGGWSGACSGNNTTCSVGMSQDRKVTATFNPAGAAPVYYSLSVNKGGGGTGTVSSNPGGISCGSDCSESYLSGTFVTLTAAPATGNSFAGWGGDCTGSNSTCTVPMSQARTVTASFSVNSYGLTVTKNGAGTVTSAPAGISCGTDCSESYGYNTQVILTATATGSSSFAGWGGDCTGTATTCTVWMTQARNVTADFVASITFTVTYTPAPIGTPTITELSKECGSITVNWSYAAVASDPVQYFTVWRRVSSGSYGATPIWSSKGSAGAATRRTWTDSSVVPSTVYFYQVRAEEETPAPQFKASAEASTMSAGCVANLTASMRIVAVDGEPYSSGVTIKNNANLTYRITIGNSGTGAANISSICDSLTPNLYKVNDSPRTVSANGLTVSSPGLAWANGPCSPSNSNSVTMKAAGVTAPGETDSVTFNTIYRSASSLTSYEVCTNSAEIFFTDGEGAKSVKATVPGLCKTNKNISPDFREVTP